MRVSALFDAKNLGFLKIYGMSVRTKGKEVEPVRTFFGQGSGEGSFFLILCRRLLWTASNQSISYKNIK